MGQINNVIINYLSDRSRFADLINAEVYHGRQVIKPEGLTEISPVTYRKQPEKCDRKPPVRKEDREDIAMRYEDGSIYRLFLLETQETVAYNLPIRSMEYVLAQYLKQLSEITEEHKRKDNFDSVDEKFSGLNKSERLKPEYIIWLYHGSKKWDGPRRLRDMMDFGDDHDGMKDLFQDFEPLLICVEELNDTTRYKTELRELMELLNVRSDNKRLREMVNSDERFDHIDEDTLEAAAILLNAPSIWKKRRTYVNDDEGRDYNMCKALEDWAAEIRAEVIKEKDVEIEQNKVQLKQKDAQLEQKDAQLEQKDAQLEQKDAQLEQNKVQLEQNKVQIESMQIEIDKLRAQLASAAN